MPKIATATSADAAALAALRAMQGWAGAESLLRATLAWEGCRTFVLRAPAEANSLIGSTLALAAPSIGIIGNVIVDAHYQRQGLGRRLMRAALDWQRGMGVRTVLLDATVEGRPLYSRLGFRSLEANSWVARLRLSVLSTAALRAEAAGMRARRVEADALSRLTALDAAAFGGDRLGLLARVLDQGESWLYLAEGDDGAPRGYLLARAATGAHASLRPGPFIARTPEAAAALLLALHEEETTGAPWRAALGNDPLLFLSVPGTSPAALRFFARIGAEVEVDDLLMRLDFAEAGGGAGDAPSPPRPIAAHPEWVYAWLAPMVF